MELMIGRSDKDKKLPNPIKIVRKLNLGGDGDTQKDPRYIAQLLEGKKKPEAIALLKDIFSEEVINKIIAGL